MSAENPHSLPRRELMVIKGQDFASNPQDFWYESGVSTHTDASTGKSRSVLHFKQPGAQEENRYFKDEIEAYHHHEQLKGEAFVYDVGAQALRKVGIEEPSYRERQEGFKMLDLMQRRLNGGVEVLNVFEQAYVKRSKGGVEDDWKTIMTGQKVSEAGEVTDWVVAAKFGDNGRLFALKDVAKSEHEELQRQYGKSEQDDSDPLESLEQEEVREGLVDVELGEMLSLIEGMQQVLSGATEGLSGHNADALRSIAGENVVDTGFSGLAGLEKRLAAIADQPDSRLGVPKDNLLNALDMITKAREEYDRLKDTVVSRAMPRIEGVDLFKDEAWGYMIDAAKGSINLLCVAKDHVRKIMQDLERSSEELDGSGLQIDREDAQAPESDGVPELTDPDIGNSRGVDDADSVAGILNESHMIVPNKESAPAESDVVRATNVQRILEGKSLLGERAAINLNRAVGNVQKIIGQNGKGGGTLGDKLRGIAPSAGGIVMGLAQPGSVRDGVLGELRMRTQHLYHQFATEDDKVFLAGVREGRNKPINASDAKSGETQIDSLDKVALLALAMLDGSFRYEDDNVKNKADGGNHRDAAEKVLEDFARTQVIDKAEIHSENEEVQRVLRSIGELCGSVDQTIRRVLLPQIGVLRDSFYSDSRVDTDRLYHGVIAIEQTRQRLVGDVQTALRQAEGLMQNIQDITKEDGSKVEGAIQDVRSLRSIIDTAGRNTQDNFWPGLLNAARTGVIDAGILYKFRAQIFKHELDLAMQREVQHALDITQKYLS